MVEQFGAYRGQVVRELKLAGAPARDIEAVNNASETGEPGQLAVYAAASANPEALKPLPDGKTEKALAARILEEASPYLNSLLPFDGSMKAQNAALDRVKVVARAAVLRGESVADAVETAMKPYDRYEFRGTWRIPKDQLKGGSAVAKAGGIRVVDFGAKLVQQEVTAQDGRWLKAAPDPATGKPMPSRAYAAVVRERGRWVTTSDDSGLQLMILTPAGWFPILDDKGRTIRRSWEHLAKKRLR